MLRYSHYKTYELRRRNRGDENCGDSGAPEPMRRLRPRANLGLPTSANKAMRSRDAISARRMRCSICFASPRSLALSRAIVKAAFDSSLLESMVASRLFSLALGLLAKPLPRLSHLILSLPLSLWIGPRSTGQRSRVMQCGISGCVSISSVGAS